MSPRERSHTTHTRDEALRGLHRINRWMIAGSVALTAVLADVAANAFPGKTVKRSPASSSAAQTNAHRSSQQTSTGVLRAPEQAPRSSETAPAREAAPVEPSQESAPQESAPAHESTPTPEAAPERQAAPAQEAAPPATHEAGPPVVSGGS